MTTYGKYSPAALDFHIGSNDRLDDDELAEMLGVDAATVRRRRDRMDDAADRRLAAIAKITAPFDPAERPAKSAPTAPRRAGPAPCGTTAAYARHYRKGQKPCDKCRAAFNEAKRKAK